MNTHRIQTPEGVELEFELAGAVRRFVAWLVDMVVIVALLGTMGLAISRIAPVVGGLAAALGVALYAAINWGYFVAMEWRAGGRSLGKRALGIRVMSAGGSSVTLAQSAVRNLLRVLDGLPLAYLVGGAVMLNNPEQARLGDLVAGTVVVRERALPPPEAFAPVSAREGQQSHLVFGADSLARLSPGARAFCLELVMRRERLPIEARLRIFAEAAEYLSGRLGVDVPDHMSDETYCLNLTRHLVAAVEGARSDGFQSGQAV